MKLTGTNIKISCIEPGLVMNGLHDDWKVHPKDSMNIHDPLSVENIVDTVSFIINQPDHVRIPKLIILPKDHNIEATSAKAMISNTLYGIPKELTWI
jgi:NADP-dependent 3-hydroxy acid dehydrogenase YdfG